MSKQGSLYDTNVWLGLSLAAHPLHSAAVTEFASATDSEPALWCRASQQSVLRLLSTPTIMKQYGVVLTNRDALAMFDGIVTSGAVEFIDEPANIFPRWRSFGDLLTPSPKRWMDAYLAAFAIEANVRFVTGDTAFAAFAGLNPTILASVAPRSC